MKITKRIHRTAMGKEIDMQTLMLQNEKAVALGNANLNARGDQVDARGNIVKKREELAQEYYRANPKAVRDEPLEEDTFVADESKATRKAKETVSPVASTINEVEVAEFDEQDDAANAYAKEIIKNKEK